MNKILFVIFIYIFISCDVYHKVDVLIVGGGTSGTTAGIQSARMGAQSLIVEEGPWLGGMLTSAGVSAIDGNHKLPGGLWGEFRDKLEHHYGGANKLSTGWVSKVLFEPSVGKKILADMVAGEPNLEVKYNTSVTGIKNKKGYWLINLSSGNKKQIIKASVLIDGTELGDIAKECGATYDVGMDARTNSGESIAGTNSNDIIQDLTYVAILKDYGHDIVMEKPEGYDPSHFFCSCKSTRCTNPKEGIRLWDCKQMITYGKLPNNKYMINWPIQGNDYYLNLIEMKPDEREEALKKAKQFTLNFVYYIHSDLGFKSFGLADDEYPTSDKLPIIPYHRESRRIHGMVRFNLNHVVAPFDQSEKLYRTNIAVGDYPVDHHHARYQGESELPNLHFYPIPSYGLPLGTMIPNNKDNLIVAEKSISVSNLINGTTRLQPVVLQIGQAAGALAALSIKDNVPPSKVPVRRVQHAILEAGGYLQPYLDLSKTDIHFKAVQRIGSTGILRGRGINVGWENQTWFDTDSILTTQMIQPGLKEFAPDFILPVNDGTITIDEAVTLVYSLAKHLKIQNVSSINKMLDDFISYWKNERIITDVQQEYITRKEFAVLLDKVVNPFDLYPVSINGEFNRLIK